MQASFSELGIHAQLAQTLAGLGYAQPTPIQTAMIPLMLDGHDVIGQAQTGTGKTAAFALPMLERLEEGLGHIQGLVLAPTRELAMQVAGSIEQYAKSMRVRTLAVYGGQAYGQQTAPLRRGVDILVGTPGRILDLMRQQVLDLGQVSMVVLDEADEMLSMGFIEDIQAILAATPSQRQTALFSATLPPEIRRIAERHMRDPRSCAIACRQMTVEAVEQRYYLVRPEDKSEALARLLEMEDVSSALVFARTRLGTAELAERLAARGFSAEALSGHLSQDARIRVLERFRAGQVKFLVATDVAARGLDIDDISHVINFDPPQDPEVYVHRVGRTGRAGRSGIAISLITPRERWLLAKIEKFTRQRMQAASLPSVEDMQRRRDAKLLERMAVWLQRGRCRRELDLVAQLAEAGHDPMEIAAVALKMAQQAEGKSIIAPIAPVESHQPSYASSSRAPARREPWGKSQRSARDQGMVRLSLSRGKAHGITVSHVVGSLSHHADIPGRTIGRVNIEESRTLVDIPQHLVDQVLSKASTYRIGRQSVTLERA